MTTWKQFKDAVESQGVLDDTPIGDIDWQDGSVPRVVFGGDGVDTAIIPGKEVVEDDEFDLDDEDDDDRDEDWDDDYGDEEDAHGSH